MAGPKDPALPIIPGTFIPVPTPEEMDAHSVAEILGGNKVQFIGVTDKSVSLLRKLNEVLFPVTYPDSLYTQIVATATEDFSFITYLNDIAVAASCCKVEKVSEEKKEDGEGEEKKEKKEEKGKKKDDKKDKKDDAAAAEDKSPLKVYIMTFGVLAPYRHLGIARAMLKRLLDNVEKEPRIVEVQLHVQITNKEAIKFYEQNGFVNNGQVNDYYKRIDPPHAFFLTRKFTQE